MTWSTFSVRYEQSSLLMTKFFMFCQVFHDKSGKSDLDDTDTVIVRQSGFNKIKSRQVLHRIEFFAIAEFDE